MILDENQYKTIVDASPNMIWRSGTDALCNYFNKTWLHFTGKTIEQEVGNGWTKGVHPDDFDFCVSFYMASFNKQEPFEMNYRLKRSDGIWRWINDRGVPFFDEDNVFQGYIGSCMDITNQIMGEKFKTMAQIDGLTGVNNRQYFMQLAAEEFEKAERYHQPFCLVMIDIDKFKSINDTYGHLDGDEVLRHFARVIFQDIRKFDVAGRYGGDEFILIFPNTDMPLAIQILKRIENAIQVPIDLPDQITLAITISYGITQMQEEDTLESLIKKSDQAMYLMKRTRL